MKKNINSSKRLNSVGGQAVIEGVMMKSGDKTSLAVRLENGDIDVKDIQFRSIRKKVKFLNIPLLRGVVNFVEMMILSFKTLNMSAEALGLEDEESKFELWLKDKFGKSILDIVMVIATILGLALGVGLFMFLPTLTTKGIDSLLPSGLGFLKSAVEGLVRIAIFVLYIWLTSFMKDIRRTYGYHGAEHKSIACYESGLELTPENAKSCTRFHPRCGTSFMFVMLILSIIVFSFVSWDNIYIRMGMKLLLVPLIVGIGYEFIMLAGKHPNIVTKILSAPGMWMQRITTREPDDGMLEVAICALKSALPNEFPDFNPSLYIRGKNGENDEIGDLSTDSTGLSTESDINIVANAPLSTVSTDFSTDSECATCGDCGKTERADE
jgi:Predicted metal-dependent enzyme